MIETYYSVEEIASRLGYSVYTVRRWIKSGELAAIKGKGRTGHRVAESDLNAFIERRRAAEVVDEAVSAVTGRL